MSASRMCRLFWSTQKPASISFCEPGNLFLIRNHSMVNTTEVGGWRILDFYVYKADLPLSFRHNWPPPQISKHKHNKYKLHLFCIRTSLEKISQSQGLKKNCVLYKIKHTVTFQISIFFYVGGELQNWSLLWCFAKKLAPPEFCTRLIHILNNLFMLKVRSVSGFMSHSCWRFSIDICLSQLRSHPSSACQLW